MSEWNELTIGELPLTIGDGNYSSKYPSAKEFKTSGVPFISNKDIKNGRILSGDLRYITPEKHAELKKGHIKEHDILVSTRANIGDIAYVDASFEDANINAQLVFLRCDEKTLHSRFLYHLLSSMHYHAIFQNHASGSAQMQLPIAALREISIIFPEFNEQQNIAAVLSSLDDKIDLLHRQNKTLEAMAEALFRQWFVEEVQEEWEERPLSSWGAIICGKTPSKSESRYFGGEIPFIKIPDMHGQAFICQTEDSLTTEGRDSQPRKSIPAGAICVSCIATVGLVSMATTECQTNQQINSIVPEKDEYRYFLFLYMKSSYDLLHAMASGGTATLNLNTGNFSNIAIPFPGETLLEDFNKVATPLFQKVLKNHLQIRTLEKLRDSLLPKLMSGEVRVELEPDIQGRTYNRANVAG